MAELIEFDSFEECAQYNESFIKSNYYAHYYLIRQFNEIQRSGNVYAHYNIVGNGKQKILAVNSDFGYSLYGSEWDAEMLDLLCTQIGLKLYSTNISFNGNKKLIQQLFEKQNEPFNIYKERIVYDCEELNEIDVEVDGNLELCSFRDFKVLSQLAYTYHLDEYGKDAYHSFETIKKRVEDGIRAKTYYLFRDGNRICGMAQLFNQKSGYPFIGGFVTDRALRGRGYGTAFLYDLTDKVFDDSFDKCGLVSDAANPASNKVFRKVGYKPIYEYISMHTLNPSSYL